MFGNLELGTLEESATTDFIAKFLFNVIRNTLGRRSIYLLHRPGYPSPIRDSHLVATSYVFI